MIWFHGKCLRQGFLIAITRVEASVGAGLDDSQRAAVSLALSAQDVALIHGAPAATWCRNVEVMHLAADMPYCQREGCS